jgi:hypothetical protein
MKRKQCISIETAFRPVKQFFLCCGARQLQNGGLQTWHGHLACEKRAISHEMQQGITGKMPVPRYFAPDLGLASYEIVVYLPREIAVRMGRTGKFHIARPG